MTEEVNHPQHYGGEDNPYEVIKVLRAWNLEGAKWFCWGNVIKYLGRAEKKGNLKDYEKADWYATELLAIEAELVSKRRSMAVNTLAPTANLSDITAQREDLKKSPLEGEWRPLPPVNSHWIWRQHKDGEPIGPRCRVIVTSLRSGCVHTTTLAIEGQPLPLYSLVKSTYTVEQFHKECRAIDAEAINPWPWEKVRVAKIWPPLGSEWIWDKDNPHARCRVKVTKIGKTVGNEFVTCKVITRDPTGTCKVGTECTNDLARWHEAVTPIPSWPYSWEKI
jgi:hypothetical protein